MFCWDQSPSQFANQTQQPRNLERPVTRAIKPIAHATSALCVTSTHRCKPTHGCTKQGMKKTLCIYVRSTLRRGATVSHHRDQFYHHPTFAAIVK